MAKLIFVKDSSGQEGTLVHIAENQSVYDSNKNFDESLYDVFDISSEDFTDIKNNSKFVVSHDGTNITYGIPDEVGFTDQASLDSYIASLVERFDFYLRDNSDKPLAADVNTTKTYIQNLDTSAITPMSTSLEKYASDQGQTFVHPLELL